MAPGTQVLRIDAGTLRPPVRTSQGFLRVDGLVARSGIYEYVNTKEDEADGLGKVGDVRYELRPESEVYRADVLAQYDGAPITVMHPKKMLDPKNVRAFEVGHVSGPGRRDGDRVGISMMIKDAKAIDRVDRRELVQLSPGYKCKLEEKAGFAPEYASRTNPRGYYNFIQRDITVNHIALVDRARGGEDLQIRMDAADMRCSVERGDCGCASSCGCDAPSPYELAEGIVEQALGIGKVYTDSVDGHQHIIDGTSGRTSYATSVGSDAGHDHAFVQNRDGSYLVLDNAGHSHALMREAPAEIVELDAVRVDDGDTEQAVAVAAVAEMPPVEKTDGEDSAGASSQRLDGMGPQVRPVPAEKRAGAGTIMETEEQIRSLKAQLAESEKLAKERMDALDEHQARADRAEARATTLEQQARELETRLAAGASALETDAIREQAERADRAETVVRDNEARFDAAVRERTATIRRALVVMGDEFNPDRMSSREIQSIVVKRLDSGADISLKVTDAYIAGRFDSLVELHQKTARSLSRAGGILGATRNDRADTTTTTRSDGREARASSWRNQWKQPLPSSRGDIARAQKKDA